MGKHRKSIALNIAGIVAALIAWVLIGYGACKYAPGLLKKSAAPAEERYQHDDLLRRSVGSDRTNWAPSGGR